MSYDENAHDPTASHPEGASPLPELIRTQADLEATWRHLMEPLGFGGHSVWMLLITADDVPIRHLTQVEDVTLVPAPEELASLADIAKDILDEIAPGGRVAFLRTRPGSEGAGRVDRELAAGLVEACRRAGQAVEVVHFANDVLLTPLPLDELPVPVSA